MQLPADQKDRIYDLHYSDLLSDPTRTVQGLDEWLDEPSAAQMRSGIEQWLAANP